MGLKFRGYRTVPADYRVDALALEATRRSRELGRPYSYGQLIADTTEAERDEIAERYREELKRAIRRGDRRVSGGDEVLFHGKSEGSGGQRAQRTGG